METALTAVFKRAPEGYIDFVEDLQYDNSERATLEEARDNLLEAEDFVLKPFRS